MDKCEVTIRLYVGPEGTFANATCGEDFICTIIQPTVDMSIASIMPWVRQYAPDEFSRTCVPGSTETTIEEMSEEEYNDIVDYQMAEAYDYAKEGGYV